VQVPVALSPQPALKPIKTPQPNYPPEAAAAGVHGTVIIQANVSPDGKIQDAHVVRSVSPALDQAALDAVKQWEYEPTGLPAAVSLTINISFNN
jgi:protein TonB